MHNIKLIRKEPDHFLKKLDQRNIKISLKDILNFDKKNPSWDSNINKLKNITNLPTYLCSNFKL